MSFYIGLQRYPAPSEFRTTWNKIVDSLTKTSELVVKLKQIDEDDFLKVSPSSLKRRAVALIKGTDKIKEAIEKFILNNAYFSSQLSLKEKEDLFKLAIYKNTSSSSNLQKVLFEGPCINLEITSISGQGNRMKIFLYTHSHTKQF